MPNVVNVILLTICGRPNTQTSVKHVEIRKRKCPDFRDRLHDMTHIKRLHYENIKDNIHYKSCVSARLVNSCSKCQDSKHKQRRQRHLNRGW